MIDQLNPCMEKSSDKELMILVLKKNTRAFKILYQRYELGIFNYILRYTGSREIDVLVTTWHDLNAEVLRSVAEDQISSRRRGI